MYTYPRRDEAAAAAADPEDRHQGHHHEAGAGDRAHPKATHHQAGQGPVRQANTVTRRRHLACQDLDHRNPAIHHLPDYQDGRSVDSDLDQWVVTNTHRRIPDYQGQDPLEVMDIRLLTLDCRDPQGVIGTLPQTQDYQDHQAVMDTLHLTQDSPDPQEVMDTRLLTQDCQGHPGVIGTLHPTQDYQDPQEVMGTLHRTPDCLDRGVMGQIPGRPDQGGSDQRIQETNILILQTLVQIIILHIILLSITIITIHPHIIIHLHTTPLLITTLHNMSTSLSIGIQAVRIVIYLQD